MDYKSCISYLYSVLGQVDDQSCLYIFTYIQLLAVLEVDSD